MLLAAGRGERLAPLTDRTPKPLIEIAGQPLIVHQLRWLAAAGIRDLVINLHHLGTQIEVALGDGSTYGVSIRYSREPELLETGGGILNALPLLGDAPFLVLNGDIWTDFDFASLPTELGTDQAHLVVTDTPAHRSQGDFDLEGDRLIREGSRRRHTYCGISVLSPGLFDGIGVKVFSLRDRLFAAAAKNRLGGQLFRGSWIDIGSPEQLDAVRLLESGVAPGPASGSASGTAPDATPEA